MRHFVKGLLVAAMLTLTACGTPDATNPDGLDPGDRAAIVDQLFTGAETAYTVYLRWPECGGAVVKFCADKQQRIAIVRVVAPLDEAAFQASQVFYNAAHADGTTPSMLDELEKEARAKIGALKLETAKIPTS